MAASAAWLALASGCGVAPVDDTFVPMDGGPLAPDLSSTVADDSATPSDAAKVGDATTAPASDATTGADATTMGDAAIAGDVDSAVPQMGGDDGTPVRQSCVAPNGKAVTLTHGRLDGILVSTVQPGGSKVCNGDKGHLHLQLKVKGAIYDVAVNVSDPQNVDFTTHDMAIPGGAWSEGWHPGVPLDYPSLGVHSGDFTPLSESALTQKVLAELASANHLAVFGLGYGPTGIHDIHRRGGSSDGAIIVNPLAAKSHLLLFHFATQTF